RWRIPPENSCGYCLARAAASGRPADSSASTTFALTFWRLASPCASRVSATCVPILATGFRFDIGSCGTRPMSRPRMPRSSLSDALVMSRPSRRMLPAAMRPPPASSPMIAMAVVDLPEPDSPTIATVSPAEMSRSTPSTAWTTPSIVLKSTARSRTDSSGAAMLCSVFDMSACPRPRVHGFAQRLTEQGEAERCDGDADAGEERQPRRDRQLALRVGQHPPPLGGLGAAAAESEERQRGGVDDRGRQRQRALHDDRSDRVRQHVRHRDASAAESERLRREHVVAGALL